MSLRDDLIRHQVFLQRTVPDIINKSSVNVKRAKYRLNTDADNAAITQLYKAIDKAVDDLPIKLNALAKYEEKFNRKLLTKVGVSTKKVSNDTLLSNISTSTVKLSINKQALMVDTALKEFKRIQKQRINQMVLDNLTQAKTKAELSKALTEFIDGRYTSQYKALTATLVNSVSSEARLSVYRETDIEVVIWRSELDDAVCETCEALEGQEFTLDEFADACPAHANCRCFAEPLLDNTPDML